MFSCYISPVEFAIESLVEYELLGVEIDGEDEDGNEKDKGQLERCSTATKHGEPAKQAWETTESERAWASICRRYKERPRVIDADTTAERRPDGKEQVSGPRRQGGRSP